MPNWVMRVVIVMLSFSSHNSARHTEKRAAQHYGCSMVDCCICLAMARLLCKCIVNSQIRHQMFNYSDPVKACLDVKTLSQ